MVDPSCSGSGIVTRMDKFVDEAEGTSDKKVGKVSCTNILNVLANDLIMPFLTVGIINIYHLLAVAISIAFTC